MFPPECCRFSGKPYGTFPYGLVRLSTLYSGARSAAESAEVLFLTADQGRAAVGRRVVALCHPSPFVPRSRTPPGIAWGSMIQTPKAIASFISGASINRLSEILNCSAERLPDSMSWLLAIPASRCALRPIAGPFIRSSTEVARERKTELRSKDLNLD